MSQTIWKFPLAVQDEQLIDVPKGSQILSVATQHGQLCVWAIVDPEAELLPHKFSVRGTGHAIVGDEGTYIGTAQMAGGQLVWHVFKVTP